MELVKRLSFLVFLFTLISCGGGSGGGLSRDNTGGGTTTPTPDPIVLALSLSSTKVTGQQPATLNATVTQGGSAVAGTVVTFSTSLGALSPSSGTALTNSEGIASITLTAGAVRGAGTITASLSSGEQANISFESQGDDIAQVGDVNIGLRLVDQNGNAVQTITGSQSGRLIATVNGITSPVIVTFNSTVGNIPITTAITNASNEAITDITAGDTLGAGKVTATLDSGESGETLIVVGATNLRMGSGNPFEELKAAITLAQVSAGGTSVISVDIIDEQGNKYTEPVEVNFSSTCSSAGTPTATLSSPVTTSNGTATSTYLAKGCVGDDPINVSANAGGINLSASTTINVQPADIGSIEFVSASPENIGILGTGIVGGSESSTIVFKVRDTDGNPVNNSVVNFALNTNVGNITLSQVSATSNAQGLVQTVVNSGTVASTIRVIASTTTSNGATIFTQSSLLVVSTGLPDQDSFSLSASQLNPEAWVDDGREVQVTARMADAFNNPVPDGTAVQFRTEGGSIDPSCTTTNGACTVTWRSQQPRPVGQILTNSTCTFQQDQDPSIFCARLPLSSGKNYLGQRYGGRVTVLATAIGEESFADKNSNNRFDESEYALFLGNNVSGLPYDLKEAFVDYNEDGVFNPEETSPLAESGGELETFVDFNTNGSFDEANGVYNGILCGLNDITNPGDPNARNQYCADPDDEPDPTKKSQKVSTNVRGSSVIVMSGNTPYFTTLATNDAISATSANFDATDNAIYIAGESTGSASIVIADLHNQQMPAGTTVEFIASVGSVVAGATYTWPSSNANGGRGFGVAVKGEADPKSGVLEIRVTTPGGVITSYTGIRIVIQ